MTRRVAPLSLPLFQSEPTPPVLTIPGIELRKYQSAVIDRLRAHVTTGGKKRVLLVAPCASGKMVMIAWMMRTTSLPTLFVAHRRELLNQCVDQLAGFGLTHVSVLRGDDDRYDPSASVTVASAQSLKNRPPKGPGLIFLDEAHRSLTPGMERDVFDAYPEATIIGATATPSRLDNRPMGDRFEAMEIATSYGELLKDGYLLEPRVYGAPVIADLSAVRINSSGEYDEDQLAEVMSSTHLRGQLVTQWLKLAHLHKDPRTGLLVPGERRRTVIFAVNVAHSKLIVDDFRRAGVRIAHLDGKTPDGERQQMLADLESGALEIVCNVNVLLEGVDIPAIKCIVHARPTESLVVWIQSTCRALRLWQEMTPIIIDHAGNRDRHGFPTEDRAWSLHRPAARYVSGIDAKVRVCPICFLANVMSRRLCAGCLFEFPRETAPRVALPKETDEQLVVATTGDLERAFFAKTVAKARSKGFKPGYAAAKFKEKYGRWPSREWSFEVDMLFSADAHWREAVEKRKREADFWNGVKVAPDATPTVALSSDPTPELGYFCNGCGVEIEPPGPTCTACVPEEDPWGLAGDGEAPFADWLESEGI